jgi:hypothetical protein
MLGAIEHAAIIAPVSDVRKISLPSQPFEVASAL